jgi:cystathionine gamma-synthase
MHIETLAVHAGRSVDPATGAVTAPINLSTTFQRESDGSYHAGRVYIRTSNPNRDALELCLTALEGGVACAAFASGSAAAMTLFQTLEPGAHVIAPLDAYHGTLKLLRDVFGPWKLDVTCVDMTDAAAVRAAMRASTRLVWVETPSNPLLRIADIARMAEIAHAGGAICAVDNTWGTPVLQRPLELGADISMHSTTKYLGGHSDVLGGALIARADDEVFQRIRAIQTGGGAVLAPFDAWLTMRGISTLPWRMRAHSAGARAVAEFLCGQPRVSVVHYPGLRSHPEHEIAARQMSDFGGMLSFQVRGGAASARAVANRMQLAIQATSLGGTETLIEHRASVEGPDTRTPDDLLRVSIGLEHPDDLIADFAQALAAPAS